MDNFKTPIDWKMTQLEHLCIKKGLVRGPFGGALKKEFFVKIGFKVYEQKNAIYRDAELGDYYVDEKKFKELKRFEVSPKDFIVSCSGTIGKIFQIPKNAKMGIINQALLKIKTNDKVIDDQYFFQYFDWDKFQSRIIDNTQGGAMQNLVGMDIFRKSEIALPPLLEQSAIAYVLGLMDTAINQNNQLIAQKELRKKWLIQNLLTGKKRLTGYGGVWKEVAMANVFNRVTRKNSENNTNVVTISAQRGFVRQTDFFNKAIASEIIDNYFLVEKGEFCYNKSYSNGYPWGATKRLNDFDKAVVTTLYICFGIKDLSKTSGDFFEQYFEANLLDRGLTKIAHEGGRAHGLLNVTPSDFFSLKITIPNSEEQTAIAQVLQAADKEIQLLKAKTDKLREQKKGMMQVLLTGKKRLKINT
ncbi:MAG: restriction endonuclease subunit S [Bacteroidota bacterium]|nr:restriction endonuclease subunit S [Odoribacter sp.]MDP3642481.1 restriction endonuclease subunit S [Bacteroidota bacterium]